MTGERAAREGSGRRDGLAAPRRRRACSARSAQSSDRAARAAAAAARRSRGRAARRLLRVLLVLVLLFLSVPAFLMIPLSFSANPSLNWPPSGFSLQYYQQMFASPRLDAGDHCARSASACGTGVLAMLIGTPAAFLLVRGQMRGKSLLLAFVLSPIIVPRMIIAVGLFYFFARVGLVGTAVGLVLGHTVVAVPYVVMTMMAVLQATTTRGSTSPRRASARGRGRRCAT